MYANATGMGAYCVSPGSRESTTLRERFGGQAFQQCRYSAIPEGFQVPVNDRPDEGRYMLVRCQQNVDFDTYNGGRDRTISIEVRFVENGTDVADVDNGLNDFLWGRANQPRRAMPVPVLQAEPSSVPIVGVPTYFTFRWVDPATNQVVRQGPYGGRETGGPYVTAESNGFEMVAQATSLRIDPNQEGIAPVTCDPSTPYVQGQPPSGQPANACTITFPRSSASARTYATKPIPSDIEDAFQADVEVTWRVTYGEGGDMRELGDGFTMRLKQTLPVREVQAPNRPPSVIY